MAGDRCSSGNSHHGGQGDGTRVRAFTKRTFLSRALRGQRTEIEFLLDERALFS